MYPYLPVKLYGSLYFVHQVTCYYVTTRNVSVRKHIFRSPAVLRLKELSTLLTGDYAVLDFDTSVYFYPHPQPWSRISLPRR